MTTSNNCGYTFRFSLLNAQDPNAGPNVIYTGTITLNQGEPSSIAGTINFDSSFTNPIDIQGTSATEDTGTLVNASGSSSEAQINLAFVFVSDGTAGGGDDSLLGGMVSLFDVSAEEWNPYIIQGVSPQT